MNNCTLLFFTIGKQSDTQHLRCTVQHPETDSEDDETLANLKAKYAAQKNTREKRERKAKRKVVMYNMSESESYDDTDNDKTYDKKFDSIPSSDSKENSNEGSSESDFNDDIPIIVLKKNKNNKKVSSAFTGDKVSREMELPDDTNNGIDICQEAEMSVTRAIEESEKAANEYDMVVKVHKTRLNNLLASNGFKMVEVAADGNCFFAASLHAYNKVHTNKQIDSCLQFRKEICQHIEKNAEEYIKYLSHKQNEQDENLMWKHFYENLNELDVSGKWSLEIADVLPRALADFSKVPVRIYSSKPSLPILDFETENPLDTSHKIVLAYCAPPGFAEHYNACCKVTTCEQIIHDSDKECVTQEESHLMTPRKQAKYITPEKKKTSRKRKATPENWKKNIRKSLKLMGKEYFNSYGKIKRAKAVKLTVCSKCPYKCSQNITQDQRNTIFSSFWNCGSYERQKDFICSWVKEKETKTLHDPQKPSSNRKKRKVAREFYFKIEEKEVRVCKTFFTATLDVSNMYVDHAMKHCSSSGTYASQENRGRHTPSNKTSEEVLMKVREHITSFPVMEGHYVRKSTNRKFLPPDLNITKMQELYQEKCRTEGLKPVNNHLYRKIFNEEYNFSFHRPKKDQCLSCNQYRNLLAKSKGRDSMPLAEKQKYDLHQSRKIQARESKENDKKRSKADKSYHAATFDLQAILSTPCSLVSQIFYKRKLNCYNLSVYSLGDGKASCFVWNESDAERGSCEIATCLTLYIKALPPSVKHVVFFSDTCAGQNRNKFMTAAMLHAVKESPTLESIAQKFLESGHSQMECDSIHATIENAKRKTEIHAPCEWDTVIRMARKKDPYSVIPLKFCDIVNFKEIAKCVLKNTKVDTKGKKVNWLQMKVIEVRKKEPESIFVKYDFDKEYVEVSVSGRSKRSNTEAVQSFDVLPRKYSSKRPISEAKKNDLISLCNTGIIREEYHHYYKNLPCVKDKIDNLPDPDANETYQDSDEN